MNSIDGYDELTAGMDLKGAKAEQPGADGAHGGGDQKSTKMCTVM